MVMCGSFFHGLLPGSQLNIFVQLTKRASPSTYKINRGRKEGGILGSFKFHICHSFEQSNSLEVGPCTMAAFLSFYPWHICWGKFTLPVSIDDGAESKACSLGLLKQSQNSLHP